LISQNKILNENKFFRVLALRGSVRNLGLVELVAAVVVVEVVRNKEKPIQLIQPLQPI
jgi:hypothetical protein